MMFFRPSLLQEIEDMIKTLPKVCSDKISSSVLEALVWDSPGKF